MTDVRLISDQTEHPFAQTHNFFCRTDKFDGYAHTSFKDSPATYSLPLKIISREWGQYTSLPAVDTTTNIYDDRGRISSTTDT